MHVVAGMIAADLSDKSQVLLWPETVNKMTIKMNNIYNSVKHGASPPGDMMW
jgi:hypothetical protein